jgi:hypothetical protein
MRNFPAYQVFRPIFRAGPALCVCSGLVFVGVSVALQALSTKLAAAESSIQRSIAQSGAANCAS